MGFGFTLETKVPRSDSSTGVGCRRTAIYPIGGIRRQANWRGHSCSWSSQFVQFPARSISAWPRTSHPFACQALDMDRKRHMPRAASHILTG
jgi:hypothetical protein